MERNPENQNPVVIVTGASSGIGAAAAIYLGGRGYRVVLAARRLERLEQLAAQIRNVGGEALAVQMDISEHIQIQHVVDETLKTFGQIDILINSAGYGKLVWLDEQTQEEIAQQIQTNLIGAIQITRAVLPSMLSRKTGHIIQLTSIASWVGLPTYSIYAANKFGLRGFLEGLRRELRGSGITVSGVYPGAVDTEFDQHAGVDWRITRVTPDWLLVSPEDVAQLILRVIQKKKHTAVIPRIMIVSVYINAHFPGFVSWLLSKFFYRSGGKNVSWRQKGE
ncbi:MAG: SDR family NAD(P)-dependent oxidoreductase [Anaerolineales bacterium]|nr:SDR family NAD(P)-dependent oxidoreductase [Anaerolineales bacterium]